MTQNSHSNGLKGPIFLRPRLHSTGTQSERRLSVCSAGAGGGVIAGPVEFVSPAVFTELAGITMVMTPTQERRTAK